MLSLNLKSASIFSAAIPAFLLLFSELYILHWPITNNQPQIGVDMANAWRWFDESVGGSVQ